jgi:hypothetical protein
VHGFRNLWREAIRRVGSDYLLCNGAGKHTMKHLVAVPHTVRAFANGSDRREQFYNVLTPKVIQRHIADAGAHVKANRAFVCVMRCRL